MARKRKIYDDDDGRTIADMNVDGMPWYSPPSAGGQAERGGEPLSGKQRFHMARGMLAAALLVAGVFAVGYCLVILLMYLLW